MACVSECIYNQFELQVFFSSNTRLLQLLHNSSPPLQSLLRHYPSKNQEQKGIKKKPINHKQVDEKLTYIPRIESPSELHQRRLAPAGQHRSKWRKREEWPWCKRCWSCKPFLCFSFDFLLSIKHQRSMKYREKRFFRVNL